MSPERPDRYTRLTPEQRRRLEQRLAQARSTAGQTPEAGVPGADETRIQAREWTGDQPLSFAQESLYFMHQLSDASPAFNRPLALRMRGPLNLPSLKEALGHIVARHSVLRCIYQLAGGGPVCRLSSIMPELALEDLSYLEQRERENIARQRVEQHSRERFNLAGAPPLRWGLLRLGLEDHVFWLVVHHIAFDAWSAGIFTSELSAGYAALAGRQDVSPPRALSFQYADYAHWQRNVLSGNRLQKDLVYWRSQLDGWADDLDLRLSGRSSGLQDLSQDRGARIMFTLPPDQAEALRRKAAAENSTSFMLLLAVYTSRLAEAAGSLDVAVGVPAAGRSQPGLEHMIGLFVNMLVFRLNLSAACDFQSLMQQVRQAAAGAFEHASAPFERIVNSLNMRRVPGRSPLFQAVFNYRHVPKAILTASPLAFEQFDFDPGVAQYLLDLEFTPGPHGLHGALIYNPYAFSADWAQQFVDDYRERLDAVLAPRGMQRKLFSRSRTNTTQGLEMPDLVELEEGEIL